MRNLQGQATSQPGPATHSQCYQANDPQNDDFFDSIGHVRDGRLRLLYEANPIALLMEQAGGRASTGRDQILDRVPRLLHERVPLFFGAREEVERIERYQLGNAPKGETSPLFARRGLFV